ncbi:DUF6292 family protein [Streptomyces incarnatus]|uniref:DUF6292 family protein n=1 Tax=Streptomyces incarnatus TaxID=665007 RepID=UPI000A907747|nr:DUF6292 family protein [Streptomyces incarnatus]
MEHCPRGIVQAFRTGKDASTDAGPKGRPKGSGDMVPRDEISAGVGDPLDEDPAVTLATVQERVGLSYAAAARALPRLRGERIADLVQAEPDLTPEEAATRLGYPTAVQRTALASAATELRARQVQPYLQRVADVLAGAGLAQAQDVQVQRLEGDVLAAAVALSGSGAPALVWDERYGWRTAVSPPPDRQGDRHPAGGRRHPLPQRAPAARTLRAAGRAHRPPARHQASQDRPPGRRHPAGLTRRQENA